VLSQPNGTLFLVLLKAILRAFRKPRQTNFIFNIALIFLLIRFSPILGNKTVVDSYGYGTCIEVSLKCRLFRAISETTPPPMFPSLICGVQSKLQRFDIRRDGRHERWVGTYRCTLSSEPAVSRVGAVANVQKPATIRRMK
jgi:hypothetical protein